MNPINPLHPLRELEDIQDRIIRALRHGHSGRSTEGQQSFVVSDWAPSVDISEDNNEYLITAELPEVKKEDVSVIVENGIVSVKGNRKFEKEEKGRKYHRIERSYGSFLRTFSLPDDADAEKVTAEFSDGLLHIRLGKSESKKPRQIEVTVN